MLQDYVIKVQTGVFDERVRQMNDEARAVAEQQSSMEAIVRGNFEDRLTKQAELGFLRVRDSENKVRRKIKEFEREAIHAFVKFSEQLEQKIGEDRQRLEEVSGHLLYICYSAGSLKGKSHLHNHTLTPCGTTHL